MAILVTGGLGHIGSWVCHEMISRGNEVIVTGHNPRKLSYLENFSDRIKFVSADVIDNASVVRLFKEHQGKIEGVIHIAGLMGGPYFATKPRHHVQINVMGTLDMLEMCRIFGIERFVYISSGSVFGVRSDIPKEGDPLTPADLYGAAKASSEMFGLQYAGEFGLDFRAVRVYFAYGPGRLPSELYPMYKAVFGSLTGETRVGLPAGADQMIDFTYTKDIAKAIRLVYEANSPKHRQYNVTSGVCHPLPDLIRTVAKIAGVELDIDIGPGLLMPRGPSLDCTRLRDELGYAPDYDIEKGVKEYLDWIRPS